MLVSFECLELTSALAGSHVCDCGVIWKVMVLGVQQQRAGAVVFCGGGEGGGDRCGGGQVCDVVVTLCYVRRLGMPQPLIDPLLLLG
jgi:hypothetical protein